MAPTSFGSFGLKLVQLYVLLSSSEHSYTLTRLSQIFRCSRQSILRMVEQLELLPKIKLQSYKEGKERHYRIITPFAPSEIEIDIELLRRLMQCRDIVRHLLPTPVHEEIGRALDSIAGSSDNTKDAGTLLDSHSEAFWKGRIDYNPHQDTIQKLYIAIDKERLCHVQYRPKINGATKKFFVAPLRILAFHEALYARCLKCSADGTVENETPMTLAIHRIYNIEIRQKKVITSARKSDTKHFGFWFNKPFTVRIRFTSEAATFVGERCWSTGQELTVLDDGGLELIFTSTSRPEIKSWVLSFADAAELLEPTDLREEIQDTLQQMQKRYR
ncbi:MAG: WYL domain-containing protein [Candidatus Hydrogenedentes bacterium]|nr:WYL domain-containing protein [Candidatus Hydrogenedentota bacterium]